MLGFFVVVALYFLVLGLFAALGGIRSAGEAFRMWGESSSSIRNNPGSSS
jgi:hypothetical protein